MNHDYYHIHEWTPKLRQMADDLVAQVYKVAPELEILFMGAASLGLPVKNDLDLDILCDGQNIKYYADILRKMIREQIRRKN